MSNTKKRQPFGEWMEGKIQNVYYSDQEKMDKAYAIVDLENYKKQKSINK